MKALAEVKGSGLRRMGESGRPTSPEKTRVLGPPPALFSVTEMAADPRTWPASAEFDGHGAIAEEVELLAVFEGFEKGDGFFGVLAGVEGLDVALPGFVCFLVEVAGVFLLDLGGVEEHEGGDGGGGAGAVDGAGEALLDEVGEVAAVVLVGVGEDDDGDGFGGRS